MRCGARSAETTTPIARTMTSAGSTGRALDKHGDIHRFTRLLLLMRSQGDLARGRADLNLNEILRQAQGRVARREAWVSGLERRVAQPCLHGRHAGWPVPGPRDGKCLLGAADIRAPAARLGCTRGGVARSIPFWNRRKTSAIRLTPHPSWTRPMRCSPGRSCCCLQGGCPGSVRVCPRRNDKDFGGGHYLCK